MPSERATVCETTASTPSMPTVPNPPTAQVLPLGPVHVHRAAERQLVQPAHGVGNGHRAVGHALPELIRGGRLLRRVTAERGRVHAEYGGVLAVHLDLGRFHRLGGGDPGQPLDRGSGSRPGATTSATTIMSAWSSPCSGATVAVLRARRRATGSENEVRREVPRSGTGDRAPVAARAGRPPAWLAGCEPVARHTSRNTQAQLPLRAGRPRQPGQAGNAPCPAQALPFVADTGVCSAARQPQLMSRRPACRPLSDGAGPYAGSVRFRRVPRNAPWPTCPMCAPTV